MTAVESEAAVVTLVVEAVAVAVNAATLVEAAAAAI